MRAVRAPTAERQAGLDMCIRSPGYALELLLRARALIVPFTLVRMRRSPLVIALLACLGLAIFTSYKLHKMTRIRDDQNGVTRIVDNKTSEPVRRGTACYLWSRSQRIQADCDYWERINIGDTFEIVEVDGKQYVKGGDVYTSPGNFVFDIVLLVAEITGFLVCLVLLIRGRPLSAASR